MDRLCLVNSVPFKVPIQIVAQKIRYPSFSKSGVTNIRECGESIFDESGFPLF